MTSNKLFGSKRNLTALFISFIAFVLVFCFETILNLKIKTMQTLPSDFENLYWGARLAGYNWRNDVNPSSFSLLQSIIYALLFKLVHRGPLFMWQVFLLTGVFFRSIPAFVATNLAKRLYNFNSLESITLGILVALVIPTRGTSLSKQAFVIGIMWVLIYLIGEYFNSAQSSQSVVLVISISVVTGLLVALDYTLIYIFIIEAIFLIFCSSKKKNREVIIFGIVTAVVVLSLFLSYRGVCLTLGLNRTDLFFKPFSISPNKIQYLPTLFAAVLWEAGIYSYGVVVYIIVFALLSLFFERKNSRTNDYFSFNRLTRFLVIIMLIQMVINSVILLGSIEINAGDVLLPSASLFNISELGFVIAPMVFLTIIHKQYTTKPDKKTFFIFLVVLGIAVLYVFCSLIIPANANGIVDSQLYWAANSSPFLYLFETNSLGSTGLLIFIVYLVTAVLCYFAVNLSQRDEVVFILTVLFVFQYVAGWIYNDGALRNKVGNFNLINGTNRFMTLYPDIFAELQDVYFAGDYSTMAMLQFALKDTSLILEMPDSTSDEYVMFSQYAPDVLCYFVDLSGSRYIVTDEDKLDEYIYIKGDTNLELFDKPDIVFHDL